MTEVLDAEQLQRNSANEENLAQAQSHRLHELAFGQHDPNKFEAISEAARILADEGEGGADMSLVALENGNSWDDEIRDEALAIRRLDSDTFLDFDDASKKIRHRVGEYRSSGAEELQNEANALQYSLANIERGDAGSARNLLRILEANLASYASPGIQRTELLRQEVDELRSLRDAVYVKTKELEVADTRKKAEDDQAIESEIAASVARDSVTEAFRDTSSDGNVSSSSEVTTTATANQENSVLEELKKKEQAMSEADKAYSRQISRLAGEGLIDVSNSALARELSDTLSDDEKALVAQDMQAMYRKYFDERVGAKTSKDVADVVTNFKAGIENLSSRIEMGDYFKKEDQTPKKDMPSSKHITPKGVEQVPSSSPLWSSEAVKEDSAQAVEERVEPVAAKIEQTEEAKGEALKQFMRNSMAKVPKQLLLESVRRARPDLDVSDTEALALLSEGLDSVDYRKYVVDIRNNGFHESNGGFWSNDNPNSLVGKIAKDARGIVDRIVSDSLRK